jgi:hypothetical protein
MTIAKRLMSIPLSTLKYKYPSEVLSDYIAKMENGENLQVEKSPVVLKKVFQFTVVLCDNTALPIWREVIVNANITFRKFHRIIQNLFSWQDYHLHDFVILSNTEPPVELVKISDDYCENQDEYFFLPKAPLPAVSETIKLSKYFGEYRNCMYTYDYGDGWRHTITLKNVMEDYELDAPQCIMGEGNAPPEDSGGIGGYAEMLRFIAGEKLSYDKDATEEDYEIMRECIASTEFEEFNIDIINKRLKKLR